MDNEEKPDNTATPLDDHIVQSAQLTPQGPIESIDTTQLQEESPPPPKKLRSKNKILLITILTAAAITTFIFLSVNNKDVQEPGRSQTYTITSSLLGYVDSLSNSTEGDVTLSYQGARGKEIQLDGTYYVHEGRFYIDVIEDHDDINSFIKSLIVKNSADSENEFKFEPENHGVPEFYEIDIANFLGVIDFGNTEGPTQSSFLTSSLSEFTDCSEHENLKEFVNDLVLGDLPLLEAGNAEKYLIDDGSTRQEYSRLALAFFDVCVIPNLPAVDSGFYDSVRAGFAADQDSVSQSIYTINIRQDGDVTTFNFLNSNQDTGISMQLTLGKSRPLSKTDFSSSQPLIGVTSEFALTMETCRHAPVIGSNFAASNSYHFISASTFYKYPSELDSTFTCSTRHPSVVSYHASPLTNFVVQGNIADLSDAAVEELVKLHEISTALEARYKTEGNYPSDDEILQLTGEYLKDTDFIDSAGKMINQGSLNYTATEDRDGFELKHIFKLENDITIDYVKKHYHAFRQ